jgi:hypothetical protein
MDRRVRTPGTPTPIKSITNLMGVTDRTRPTIGHRMTAMAAAIAMGLTAMVCSKHTNGFELQLICYKLFTEKGKLRPKGNQHYPKMMANFRPQIPIMSTLPSFSMKGFNNPQFATSFPTFGGQFPTMGGITGVNGISGIGGLTGGMKGFGGIKSKLSLLLGNKFGMGGTGGLLGGMMGWD